MTEHIRQPNGANSLRACSAYQSVREELRSCCLSRKHEVVSCRCEKICSGVLASQVHQAQKSTQGCASSRRYCHLACPALKNHTRKCRTKPCRASQGDRVCIGESHPFAIIARLQGFRSSRQRNN